MCLVILMCTCVCKPHKDIRIITVVRKQTMKKYKAIEAANASSDEIKKLFYKTFFSWLTHDCEAKILHSV